MQITHKESSYTEHTWVLPAQHCTASRTRKRGGATAATPVCHQSVFPSPPLSPEYTSSEPTQPNLPRFPFASNHGGGGGGGAGGDQVRADHRRRRQWPRQGRHCQQRRRRPQVLRPPRHLHQDRSAPPPPSLSPSMVSHFLKAATLRDSWLGSRPGLGPLLREKRA